MMVNPIIVSTIEAIITAISFVSKMNATEIVARKTPR
jgi:hypothetical protein